MMIKFSLIALTAYLKTSARHGMKVLNLPLIGRQQHDWRLVSVTPTWTLNNLMVTIKATNCLMPLSIISMPMLIIILDRGKPV